MKVALVTPTMERPLVAGIPPLNLGYLASYLRAHGDYEVKIIDGNIGQDDRGALVKFRPDVVGITATTPQARAAYRLADWANKNLDAFVVMGGVHASVMYNEAAFYCDWVVVGEGEKILLDIVNRVQKRSDWYNIPKIVKGIPIENIDEIPPPAFDLMDIEAYIRNPENAVNTLRAVPELQSVPLRGLSIITSRGCPYRCIFCWNSFRSVKTRFNSAEYIVDQLLYLKENYSINAVWFTDDEFIVHRFRLEELAKLFKEYDLNLIWGCQARATSLNVEVMELMKSFGCKLVGVGFESGNERVLQLLKAKSVTVADNVRALALSEKTGLAVGGSFILGTPSETKAEMLDTLKFIEEQDSIAFVGIGALIPYPGTPVWDSCKEKLKDVDYEELVPTPEPDKTVILCDTMSEQEYVKVFRRIHAIAGVTQRIREIYRSRSSHFIELLKLFRFKRMWYFCFFHPVKLIKLLRRMAGLKGVDPL